MSLPTNTARDSFPAAGRGPASVKIAVSDRRFLRRNPARERTQHSCGQSDTPHDLSLSRRRKTRLDLACQIVTGLLMVALAAIVLARIGGLR